MAVQSKMTIPFFRINISDDEIAEVVDSLKSGWLTTGPKVKRFEEEFAKAVGARFAVAVNSCTAALHLALEAIGLKRGDLVIVPTMTFAATTEVVRYFEAVPVFVDCDETLCINPVELKKTVEAIKSNEPIAGLQPSYGELKAVIPMHYGGFSCQMDEIMKIAVEHDIQVIEDSAHTLPAYFRLNSSSDWVHTGKFGEVGCFSFYANKCITTGEGGMAVTDNPDLADRMRIMSLHGMSLDAWKRYTSHGSWYYEIIAPGFKYNFTDIAASIGIHQLKRADEFKQQRTKVARRFTERFKQLPTIQTPTDDPETRIHSWHLYSIRLNLDRLTIDRNEFIKHLTDQDVHCSVHWMPLHLHPYYQQTYGFTEGLFPCAEREWPRLISLPIYPSITDEEIEYVIKTVENVSKRSAK